MSWTIPQHLAEHAKRLKVPDIYYFPFDRQGLEKPWNDQKEKTEDYFNYGTYRIRRCFEELSLINLKIQTKNTQKPHIVFTILVISSFERCAFFFSTFMLIFVLYRLY